jgi:hypothetical protein
MLSQHGNARKSKYQQKFKEKNRNFFRVMPTGLQGFDEGQKRSKISHACVFLTAIGCKYFLNHSFIHSFSRRDDKNGDIMHRTNVSMFVAFTLLLMREPPQYGKLPSPVVSPT